MKRKLCVLILVCYASTGFSTSFGVIGETFPVREMSFLTFIEHQLKKLSDNGAFQTMESEWLARAQRSANRPTPVGLPRATVKRNFHYDPTVILTNAILDAQGQVLYPAGTRVNGLERRPEYNPCWLMFNGDDIAQLRWARLQMRQCQHPTLILTGGAIRDAENALNAVIYFDQSARLSHKFQLKAVPVLIKRSKNRLQLSEMVIKESGDAI